MTKERIVPKYEPQDWWEEEEYTFLGGTHGASGVGQTAADRVKRRGKAPKEPRPTSVSLLRIILLLVFVGLVTVSLLFLINDMRSGATSGDPNGTVVATEPGPQIDNRFPSPDTIKLRLEKAGYEVAPLVDSYDRSEHGYDVADTEINDTKVQILAFPDKATTKDFVNTAGNTGHVIVWGNLWAINLGQTQEPQTQQLAEKIANKLHARYYWTPEGE